MRIALLSALSIFAVACGNGSPSDATTASSAETAVDAGERAHTHWCLEPKGHPGGSYGEVWSVDVTSSFGPPIEKNIRRTTGFYWRGLVTDVQAQGAASWAIDDTVEVDGTHVHGSSDQGTITIDITGQPGVSPVSGTIQVTPMSGDPEVITIVAAAVCADGDD